MLATFCEQKTYNVHADECQPARNSCPPFAWFALHKHFCRCERACKSRPSEQLSIHGTDEGQLARNSCPLSAVCLPISPLSAFHFLENTDIFHLNMTDEESNLLVEQRRNGCTKYSMCIGEGHHTTVERGQLQTAICYV